jgi:pimeloyl-ACP methyl ester carboxylesterase
VVKVVRSERPRLVADVSGVGPPIVLLHGQPGSALDWQGVASRLSDKFTVIVPDRLGYGRTGGDAAGFEANASAVATLLGDLTLNQAVVTGYSWAGGVALAFADLFPSRTAGLVLVASVGPAERFRWEDRLLAAPWLGEALAALTLGAAGRVLRSARIHRLADRHLSGRARQAVNVLSGLKGAEAGAGTLWRSFVTEQRALLGDIDELGPGLAAVSAPTVVINGSADRLVPPHVADQLAAAIPGAIHTVVPGAHHLLPHEQPDAVAAAIRQVAARAWPGMDSEGSKPDPN